MDDNTLLYVLGGVVLSYAILYFLIRNSVKEAMKDQERKADTQIRLLVKLLESRGVPKDEIIDIFEQDNNAFWDSIKENKKS